MKVLIFAPNAGVSLSTGGGASFVLRQAAAATSMGHEVTLAAFHSLSLPDLERLHRIQIGGSCKILSHAGDAEFQFSGRLPFKLSPYAALYLPAFQRFIRRTLESSPADIVWFHDDIPQSASRLLKRRRTLLYVHYPLRGRRARVSADLVKSRSLFETLVDESNSQFCPVVRSPFELVDEVWVNSSITRRVVAEVWGDSPNGVAYTYVHTPNDHLPKAHEISAVGAFSKGKGQLALIEGFRISQLDGWKLYLIGHVRDRLYYNRIQRRLKTLGLADDVVLLPNASAEAIDRILARSSVVAHAASFEPFGLSVLEGMIHGAAPVVYRGEWSGPWIDILEGGKWGVGFSSVDELAKAVREAACSDDHRRLATERARAFNKPEFESWMAKRLG